MFQKYFNRKSYLFRLLLTGLLIIFCAFTQKDISYQMIGNRMGVSNGAVTATYQDLNQYIWLGTWDGLNRYDGDHIKVYKPDITNKNAISNNIIRKIFEDESGTLWIVTENGINRYNFDSDNFDHFLLSDDDLNYKENRYVVKLAKDGNIYCLMRNVGFYKYDKQADDFIPQSTIMHPKDLYDFYFDDAQNLAIIYDEGDVVVYNNNLSKLQLPSTQVVIPEDKTYWIIESKSSSFMMSHRNDKIVISDLNNNTQTICVIPQLHTEVTSIDLAQNGTDLWLGTDGGDILKIHNFEEKLPKLEVIQLSRQKTNMGLKIWNITETKDGLLWIGTDGEGVCKVAPNAKPFRHINTDQQSQRALSHNIVRAIYEDYKGILYVGMRGGGVNIFEKRQAIKRINRESGLSNNAVLSLGADDDGNIWIGLDGEGIDILCKHDGKVRHFPDDFTDDQSINFGSVYTICSDAFGDMWLGTSGYGIIQVHIDQVGQEYKVSKFNQISSKNNQQLKSDIIYSIVESEPNVLWIGSRGKGLLRYNIITNKFENISQKSILNNNDVLSICKGLNQELWVGTSGGVTQLFLATTPLKAINYTEKNGLANNTIHTLELDESGNIWMSTNKGLSKFDRENKKIINFETSDGLLNYEYTDGASYYSPISKQLYFGGTRGLDYFLPDSIRSSKYFPPLVFTDFFINQKRQVAGEPHSILKEHLNKANKLELNYNQNFFSFAFTTLNYNNKQKAEYKYRLYPFQEEWITTGKNPKVSFTNVPPGDYTFSVKWNNEDGIWCDQPRCIAVNVYPAWYNSLPAYIIYLLLIILLIWSIYKTVIWREKEKNQILVQELKYKKLEEINTYKLQFFTNIAHEFRTPLTLIMAPAITLMQKFKTNEEVYHSLNMIHSNSRRMLQLISELTDFRKVETGNKRLEIQSYNLAKTVISICDAFSAFAHQSHVKLICASDVQSQNCWFDSNVVEKIVTNLISNAIKYTPQNGEVNVRFYDDNKGYSLIEIKDTGIGIPPEVQHKIFDRFFYQYSELPKLKGAPEGSGVGLALTKSLVEHHRGEIKLESVQGKGSLFTVKIPTARSMFEDKEIFSTPIINNIKDVVDREINSLEKPSLKSTLNKQNVNVLIVDDNEQIRELLSSILLDYNTYKAQNGAEALQVVKDQTIEIVISDIVMPEIDGLELCKLLKSDIDTCHIPVILLTAKGTIEQRIEGIEMGADSYIPKPFDPRHLLVRVEQLLESKTRVRKALSTHSIITEDLLENYTSRDSKFIESLNTVINDQMDNPELNSDLLIQQLAMSKTQLYRKIKALTDMTPHAYINETKIKRAALLLETTDYNVTEIIDHTGFNNRTYFYRLFKKVHGKSPKEYRTNNNKRNTIQ